MSRINRRSLFTAVGLTCTTVITGCLGDDSPNGEGTNGDDGQSGNGGEEDFHRTVNRIGYDDVPAEIPLSISMEVTEEQITADTTGHLRKEIENTHDNAVSFGRIFYKGRSREEQDPGLLVYSLDAQDTPSIAEAVHCVPGADQDAARGASDMSAEGPPSHVDIEPGRTVAVEYLISADWEVDECFPPGEYRFEGGTSVTLDGDGTETEDLQWGFTVEISD